MPENFHTVCLSISICPLKLPTGSHFFWYERPNAQLRLDSRLLALHLPKATHIVDTATGQELMRFRQESVLTISDEGRIIACHGNGAIRLVDRATGQELSKLSIPQWRGPFALAPDGRTIATANYPNGISLYETRGGKLLSEFPLANVRFNMLTYSPDGKTLASGQADSTAPVWDLIPGLRQLGDSVEKPAEADLETCWADLANADAKKARAAVSSFARSPNTAVPFLKRRLRPIEHTSQEKIKSLLDDLESNDAAVWQKAGRTLCLLGTEAESAMRFALRCEYTAPAKQRIESLLKTPANRGLPTGETLRVLRAIHALELIGSPETVKILADLAGGAPSAPETLEAQGASVRLAARR